MSLYQFFDVLILPVKNNIKHLNVNVINNVSHWYFFVYSHDECCHESVEILNISWFLTDIFHREFYLAVIVIC